MSPLAALLAASARLRTAGPLDLWHLIPGTGSELASAHVIAAAEEATGVPVGGRWPVNVARVRFHLREFTPR